MSPDLPTLEAMRATRARIGDYVLTTPVRPWSGDDLEGALGATTRVVLKEELFQRTGSFKPRGALAVMLDLPPDVLRRGVTAVSAGNHAMAVAYAARVLKTTAKVVMPRSANPFRVRGCRDLGAEVELVDDVHRAFERVKEIETTEGRSFVHPFEGPKTALGTATLGLEICDQVPDLDAVIVPIGGGGLCAGVAAAVKLARPKATVVGVEPTGADTMHRSFAAGSPQSIPQVTTIADSLGAPHAAPYSFDLCRRFVDELVLVDDDALRSAMLLLFRSAKLAVEPAGAAATAALLGPLKSKLRGRTVVPIVCGANIDAATFSAHLAAAGAREPAPA
ncbi:MAG TPA: threonine/serine dehydratase [Candidatus Cryosericum sp.]|nr:threonine/serine dehydratase [Candidatus Cryosericum sp.]